MPSEVYRLKHGGSVLYHGWSILAGRFDGTWRYYARLGDDSTGLCKSPSAVKTLINRKGLHIMDYKKITTEKRSPVRLAYTQRDGSIVTYRGVKIAYTGKGKNKIAKIARTRKDAFTKVITEFGTIRYHGKKIEVSRQWVIRYHSKTLVTGELLQWKTRIAGMWEAVNPFIPGLAH